MAIYTMCFAGISMVLLALDSSASWKVKVIGVLIYFPIFKLGYNLLIGGM